MNGWKKMLVLASVATLCLAASEVMAGRGGGGGNGGNGFGGGNGGGGGRGGGRGNFDPAQQRQNQLDNYKADFEIADDAEWKVIGDAIGKVMDARDDLRTSQFSGFGRRGGRGGNNNNNNNNAGGGNAATDPTATNNNNNAGGGGGRRQRGGGPGGGNPSPELAALQAAVEAKASTEDIKSRLARVREVIKTKEDKLAATQEALKQLLSTRQEGIAVLLGLLK